MHNLAIELQRKGYTITGSDDEIYEPSRSRLEQFDLLPATTGWSAERITPDLDAVIVGMHARKDNPELLKAQELGIKIYSYPEFIFGLNRDKQRIVVAGSHGKTTITSIILHVLRECRRDFNYVVGAGIEGFDTMVRLRESAPIIIIEGDEYFSSPLDATPKFLHYQPHVVVISGIAWDHYNVFPSWESYVKQFELLADALPKSGTIIFDESDHMLEIVGRKERKDVTSIPYEAHPHKIIDGQTYLKTARYGEVPLLIFGEHNMKNISAALATCEKLGISEDEFYGAVRSFKGASKRLELIGKFDSVNVYRDFAHAPSKVEASTIAVKDQFPRRKLVAVAELHTFSSLNKEFIGQYSRKLNAADIAAVFYNPHTLEQKRLPALSPEEIKAAFGRDDLQVFSDPEELKTFLLGLKWQDANLLMMSSGTFGETDLAGLVRVIGGL